MISRSESARVKLLGKGDLAVALKVRVHAASAAAKSRIEAAGGTLEIIGAEA
jgi:large subunit ribosomal protein L15